MSATELSPFDDFFLFSKKIAEESKKNELMSISKAAKLIECELKGNCPEDLFSFFFQLRELYMKSPLMKIPLVLLKIRPDRFLNRIIHTLCKFTCDYCMSDSQKKSVAQSWIG